MRSKPPVHTWFLPVEGECPDQRWRATYRSNGGMTVCVEVCAPNEDTAVMRAGMKRAGGQELFRQLFPQTHADTKWERLSVERI